MSSIYLPGLVYRIFQAFNIKTNKFKGFDFQSNEVFALKDIIKIQPNVNSLYFVVLIKKVKVKTQYSLCIEQLLKHAREKDSIGKRSKWFLEGGPERIEATNLFREAAAISEYVRRNINLIKLKDLWKPKQRSSSNFQRVCLAFRRKACRNRKT